MQRGDEFVEEEKQRARFGCRKLEKEGDTMDLRACMDKHNRKDVMCALTSCRDCKYAKSTTSCPDSSVEEPRSP